jgi:putative oxidoreductase
MESGEVAASTLSMKLAANIVGGLLGLLFIAFSLMFLLKLVPMPPPPPNTPLASFMDAFMPTGYMIFVKVCELLGGILVAIPRTRNFGLLVLGPIILNILATHILIMKGAELLGAPLLVALMALFLLWTSRSAFLGLVRGRAEAR